METKIAPLALTKGAGGKPVVKGRKFSGMASTDDLDLGGDIVVASAWNGTIADWKKRGHTIPLLDQHNAHGSINNVLGRMTDAEVRKNGLWSEWEVVDSPSGDEALARVKGGYVTGLSIGYRPVKIEEPTPEEERAGLWRRITEIDLKEVSLVVFPMNPAAVIDSKRGDLEWQSRQRRLERAMKRSGVTPHVSRQDLERRVERAMKRSGLYFPTPRF